VIGQTYLRAAGGAGRALAQPRAAERQPWEC